MSTSPRVVPFPSGSRPECRHLHVTLDAARRQLVCDACNTTVDPLAWIERHALARASHNRAMRKSLDAQVAQLRREKARLEAQVDRLMRRVKGLGSAPARPLSTEVGSVVPIGNAKRPIGVHVQLAGTGRLSRDSARSLSHAIDTALDGLDLG